jgi:hypothetical protein
MTAENDVPELPIAREERFKGEPWGYGWVRVSHTVLHAGQVTAESRPIPPGLGQSE